MKSRIQKKYYTNVIFSLFKYESIFKKNGITPLYNEIEQSTLSNSVYVWLKFKDMAYRVRISDHELPLGGQMPSYIIDELISSTGNVQFPINKILLYKSKYEFYKNNFETDCNCFEIYTQNKKYLFLTKDDFISFLKDKEIDSFKQFEETDICFFYLDNIFYKTNIY